jgi:hypothetical protein
MSSSSASGTGEISFLDSLSEEEAVRYRVFLDASFSPEVIESMIAGALPSNLDAGARERLLLALSASARVFALDVSEAAVDLRAHADAAAAQQGGDAAVSTAVSAGHVAEAWRRRVLMGRDLPRVPSEAASRVIREAAAALQAAAVKSAHAAAAAAAAAASSARIDAPVATKKR